MGSIVSRYYVQRLGELDRVIQQMDVLLEDDAESTSTPSNGTPTIADDQERHPSKAAATATRSRLVMNKTSQTLLKAEYFEDAVKRYPI